MPPTAAEEMAAEMAFCRPKAGADPCKVISAGELQQGSWVSPLSTVVELMQQSVGQERAVLIDKQVLAAIDAHQQADDV